MGKPSPSALLDRLRAASGKQGGECGMAIVLATMPADYRAVIEAAVDDKTLTGTGIRSVLIEDGYDVGVDSVRRHRKRGTAAGCKCPR